VSQRGFAAALINVDLSCMSHCVSYQLRQGHMSHFTTQKLADAAGITKRHCQRLLSSGKLDSLGAERRPGGHWQIPDSAAVRAWAAGFDRWEGKEHAPAHFGKPLTQWKQAAVKTGRRKVAARSAKTPGAAAQEMALALAGSIGAAKSALVVADQMALLVVIHHLDRLLSQMVEVVELLVVLVLEVQAVVVVDQQVV